MIASSPDDISPPQPEVVRVTGGSSDTGVAPRTNAWYRFRIEVQDTGVRTEIRAKVWPDSGAEPADWQIDCYDDSPTRITAGTVGVWSMSLGERHWDELAVRHVERAYDASFDSLSPGDDPADWFDTAAGSSLLEEDNFEVVDVAFVLHDFRHAGLEFRRGDAHFLVGRLAGVSDPGQKICNGIGNCHLRSSPRLGTCGHVRSYQLALITPGISPCRAKVRKQMRHMSNLRR